MLRSIALSLVAVTFLAGGVLAADKEFTAKVVSVDVSTKILIVATDAGKKEYTISDDTKFIGPNGGVSKDGIKDKRLVKDAEVKMVVAGNNKTVREVHLPLK